MEKGKKGKNYSKGKVYTIYCNETGDTYCGSTITSLPQRLGKHKEQLKNGKNCTSYEIIKRGNYTISLVEAYPCASREELCARERSYIENNICVNKNIPGRTIKEYQQFHREKLSEYKKLYDQNHKEENKAYRIKNADKIKESKTKLFTCICGSTLLHCTKLRHEKTPRHLKKLALKLTEEEEIVEHVEC